MADILDTVSDWLFGTEETQQEIVKDTVLNTDKQKLVKIIQDLESTHSAALPIADIVAKAKEKLKFDEEKTRRIVNELVQDGYLTRPRWMEDIVRLHGVTDYSPWSEDFPA